MRDYLELASVIEEMVQRGGNGWGLTKLMRDASVMIRKQGDELNKLKADSPYVHCPRCHHMVTKILESGQCGFCDLME